MLGSGGSVDRGRLRQLLRGSVAGLCELKLLRERQEVRVRRALRGGEDLERQLWELERQLGELRLRAESDQENAEYEADGPESCDVFLDRAPRGGQAEARMHYASERPKSADLSSCTCQTLEVTLGVGRILLSSLQHRTQQILLRLHCRMSNNLAKIVEARKDVEQLKMEVNIERMKVSVVVSDILSFCQSHFISDPLVSPVPAAENPFRDKRLVCAVL
ncbi:dapper homolog 3-like isoform X4 [Engystomops pustulosus]|uniref:dapper homolog 3-like isoform X4 n=1 Tax=Engystomops pustulosus TaxID=76066 RepID=UPI003AFAA9FE